MKKAKCRVCRRLGTKLFLKGEKCLSPKCPMIKRPYPPGERPKRRLPPLSEYGKLLQEKQKLKNWYNLRERQFKNYVKKVLSQRGKKTIEGKVEDAGEVLIRMLESRLDNVIFRLGFAKSRAHARQLLVHGFFLLNGKPVKSPSLQVKEGDVISFRPQKLKKEFLNEIKFTLKHHSVPSWLQLDLEKLEGKVVSHPSLKEAAPPVEISSIFEYYSR